MSAKSLLLTAALVAAPVVALQASAQTTLPANLQAARAAVQQDRLAMQGARTQLTTDEAAGNANAVAADRTALRLARIKTRQDFATLAQDARAALQPDHAAVVAALTQLHADQMANNAAAVQADGATLAAAETQLRSDREAIFGGLRERGGGARRMRRG